MEKTIEFQKMEIAEQIAEFGKIFNLKFYKKDFEEIKKYNLYTLLTDATITDNLQNEKIKNLIKNIRNVAEIFSYTKLTATEKVSTPDAVVDFLRTKLKNASESMIAIYLTAQNKIIDYEIISTGTVGRSAVYPSKVVKSALLKNARCVIVAHNHPSGTDKPSQNDIIATDTIQKALKTVEIVLLDHIIITDNNFYSFKDNNLI